MEHSISYNSFGVFNQVCKMNCNIHRLLQAILSSKKKYKQEAFIKYYMNDKY